LRISSERMRWIASPESTVESIDEHLKYLYQSVASTSDVLLPERGSAVDAKPDEDTVHDLDACPLGVRDGRFDLFECLLLLQAVEHLLAAAFDPEHDRAAVCFRHDRKELHARGVDAALAARFDRALALDEPLADRLDALGCRRWVDGMKRRASTRTW
jgi:hypothetical protein